MGKALTLAAAIACFNLLSPAFAADQVCQPPQRQPKTAAECLTVDYKSLSTTAAASCRLTCAAILFGGFDPTPSAYIKGDILDKAQSNPDRPDAPGNTMVAPSGK